MISRLSVAAALLAAVCATQSITWGADAQSLYQQGIVAQNGDVAKGVGVDLKAAQNLLEQAAAAGSAQAMQRLGDMYHDGDGGVARDFAKAIEWYKKEAALDDSQPGNGAMGMIALGEMYIKGRGVEADRNLADDWFRKASISAKIGADKGDVMSMVALAYCLAQGKGTAAAKPDPVSAWAWVIKASKAANPWAYELTASLYEKGLGVKADQSAAVANILKAAQLGESRDMVELSLSFANGDGVKDNDQMAVDWIKKAVERGNSRAMAVLGRYYHDEVGLERSDLKAMEWYDKAIALGNSDAMGYKGDLYIQPGANPRDVNSAVTWYEKGVTAGDVYCMYQLAKILAYDSAVTANVPRAMTLLTQAANLGFADAYAAMGELYREGKVRGTIDDQIAFFRKAADAGSVIGMRDLGVALIIKGEGTNSYKVEDDDKPVMKEAFSWLQRAADAGNTDAMTDVGEAYFKGKGVTASTNNAIKWYRKGANAGNVRAMRFLGQLFASNAVVADYDEAKKWFEKGIEKNNDPACMAGLAELYDNALGVPEDNNKAFDLYQRAMKGGDPGGYRGIAQYLAAAGDYRQAAAYYTEATNGLTPDLKALEALGRMYELGQGVDKNMDKAMQLFTKAQNMGSQSAWSWVFSHTNFSATAPSTMGGTRPPMMNLEDLTGKLPPRTQPTTTQAARGG